MLLLTPHNSTPLETFTSGTGLRPSELRSLSHRLIRSLEEMSSVRAKQAAKDANDGEWEDRGGGESLQRVKGPQGSRHGAAAVSGVDCGVGFGVGYGVGCSSQAVIDADNRKRCDMQFTISPFHPQEHDRLLHTLLADLPIFTPD